MNYKDEIERLEGKKRLLEREIERRKKEWIVIECPVKIGDSVKIKGYAFQDKKMLVERITVYAWLSKYSWRIAGWVLKKDGTPGKQYTDFQLSMKEK